MSSVWEKKMPSVYTYNKCVIRVDGEVVGTGNVKMINKNVFEYEFDITRLIGPSPFALIYSKVSLLNQLEEQKKEIERLKQEIGKLQYQNMAWS